MVERFLKYIQEEDLCTKTDNILVAVSGGVDSVVMLNLFMKNGFKVGVAHCNFGLRGKESDDDEAFVRRLAKQGEIPSFFKRFETKKYAEEHGLSIQMAARQLRYSWFEEIRDVNVYNCIATGHNLNDSVETTLFNFIRGTGLKGMTGIKPKTGYIIRPLLFTSRKEIESYADDNRLDFRTDSSNEKTSYKRNYIRHKILPEFERINPGFQSTAQNTLSRLRGMQQFVTDWLETRKSTFFEIRGKDIYLKKTFFADIGEPALLYEVIGSYGFNYDQCESIFNNLKSQTGSIFYSGHFVLNNDRNHLIISPIDNQEEKYEIRENDRQVVTRNFKLIIEYIDKLKEKINPDPHVAYFDLDKLTFPLELRTWQDGDWFVPLGMKGKKKLSDFMIDKKIPLNLKKRLMVLLSHGAIIWVTGYRTDDRFKIQESTTKLLKITYLDLDD